MWTRTSVQSLLNACILCKPWLSRNKRLLYLGCREHGHSPYRGVLQRFGWRLESGSNQANGFRFVH